MKLQRKQAASELRSCASALSHRGRIVWSAAFNFPPSWFQSISAMWQMNLPEAAPSRVSHQQPYDNRSTVTIWGLIYLYCFFSFLHLFIVWMLFSIQFFPVHLFVSLNLCHGDRNNVVIGLSTPFYINPRGSWTHHFAVLLHALRVSFIEIENMSNNQLLETLQSTVSLTNLNPTRPNSPINAAPAAYSTVERSQRAKEQPVIRDQRSYTDNRLLL